jgi:hypothetical protein
LCDEQPLKIVLIRFYFDFDEDVLSVVIKIVPVHAAKAYGGGGGIVSLILNHGMRWR